MDHTNNEEYNGFILLERIKAELKIVIEIAYEKKVVRGRKSLIPHEKAEFRGQLDQETHQSHYPHLHAHWRKKL